MRHHALRTALVVVACVAGSAIWLAAGCGRPHRPVYVPEVDEDPPVVPPSNGGAPPTPANGTSAEGGTITGQVVFRRAVVPRSKLIVDNDETICGAHDILSEGLIVNANGGVQNAVVWLEGVTGGTRPWPATAPAMDQHGCVFVPHVLVAPAGQKITFTNSDPVYHNVNARPENNPPLNISLLAKGQGRPVKKRIKRPDIVKVTCDAHRWMGAWIVVRDSPYYALTGADGRYTIDNIPPGEYKLVVWHESLTRLERTVTVAAGSTTLELELTK